MHLLSSNAMYTQALLLVLAVICALGNGRSLERIVNGVDALPKEFPYQVFYDLFSIQDGWMPACGGTIISKRIILTAAHCFDPDQLYLRIYFGAVNKRNPQEKGQQRLILDIKYVTWHERYNVEALLNDIALIRLPADLEFDEYIKPAILPFPGLSYANLSAVASGWGYLKYRALRTDVLQKLDVDIMSNEECKKIVMDYNDGKFFPESFICLAPSPGVPCKGDSGGPVVLKGGLNILVGITSHAGSALCAINTPTIYTRVSSYLDWIEENSKIKS